MEIVKMGREVRRVPAMWKHPKEGGDFEPLLSGSFSEQEKDWIEKNEKWDEGFVKDWDTDDWREKPQSALDCESFEEWNGNQPQKEWYMPEWEDSEKTHYQMYETCTEGTPISPVMESPEELAQWLVDNEGSAFADQTASYEAWLRVCKGGFACSAVATSAGLESGVEALRDGRD